MEAYPSILIQDVTSYDLRFIRLLWLLLGEWFEYGQEWRQEGNYEAIAMVQEEDNGMMVD